MNTKKLLERLLVVKNAFLGELQNAGTALGIIGGVVIVGAIVALVISEVATTLPTQDNRSIAWNITQFGLQAFQNMFKQSPLLGTIIILLVIASAALGIFAFFGNKEGTQV